MADKPFYLVSKSFLTDKDEAGWQTLHLFKPHTAGKYRWVEHGIQPKGTVNTDIHILTRLVEVDGAGSGASETDVSASIAATDGGSLASEMTVYEATSGTGKFGTEPSLVGYRRHMPFHPQQPGELIPVEKGQIYLLGGKFYALQYKYADGVDNIEFFVESAWVE